MNLNRLPLMACTALWATASSALSCDFKLNSDPALTNSPSVQIKKVAVEYQKDLDLVVFSMELKASPSLVVPNPAGDLNGAPVLGYVFPTTLKAADVGMGDAEGIVALAITSHPDFDDTPLWDENANGRYDDDKATTTRIGCCWRRTIVCRAGWR